MVQKLLKILALPILLLLGLVLLRRFALPVLLPFLLALLTAYAAEPLVRVLNSRLRLPRWASAGAGVTLALAGILLALAALGAFLLRQVGNLANVLPDLESTAQQGLESLEGFLTNLANNAPEGLRPMLGRSVEGLFSGGSDLLDGVSARVLKLASAGLTRLPDSALGVGTWLLASFMVSSRLPELRQKAAAAIPETWKTRVIPRLKGLKTALGGWLLAQLKLTGITFLVLCASFLLLRIQHGPLWAALVSTLDALPVLGTGTFLVPWSLVCFLQGNTPRALGLLGSYAAAAILRSILEPRLLGKQLGLDPLVTLLALYGGFRLWGLAGMIAAPLLSVAAVQVFGDKGSLG